MTLRLFTGNRLERLSTILAGILRDPPPSPLEAELFVVQSRGMARWVSMELAGHHGVAANLRFFHPNEWVDWVHGRVAGGTPATAAFDREILPWRILAVLPGLLGEESFRPVARYLAGGESPLGRLQLADRIADSFDQYLLYRPDWIFRWEEGGDDHWQARLWRALVREGGGGHRARRGLALIDVLRNGARLPEDFPRRVSLFGISTLPPFHLEILAALSSSMDVNLFLLNPCREYWGHILSDGEMGRIERKAGGSVPEEDLHMEKGNGLLASLGALGRDFIDRVLSVGAEEDAFFEDPGEDTLLKAVQSDILHLREGRGREGGNFPPGDRSLQVHSAHGPMREMEVLHDLLLDCFERIPGLLPRDVLVMTPDIEKYAPYIQVVFGRQGRDEPRIPFTIADRSMGKESRIADRFLSLLDLPGTRFAVTAVLSLLQSPAVMGRFELAPADVERIGEWVRETRIAWGLDEEDRKARGLPAFRENTWRAGLERLLLGYAIPGRGDALFGGILPCDTGEGTEAAVLGRFVRFVEEVAGAADGLGGTKSLSGWGRFLEHLLDRFFLPGEGEEREFLALRELLRGLGRLETESRYGGSLDLRSIRWHLSRALASSGFGYGFLTGGVTFCAMVPMRSIPFRVICLAGMDGEAFPRESRPPGFDLMARFPRAGDRSRRRDDRYLFLEALLSARDALVVSYVGQDLRDNAKYPPSVVVSELIDYIGGTEPRKEGIPENPAVTEHRLQGFNRAYFTGGGNLFSFSGAAFRAARRLEEEKTPAAPFLSGRLPEPGPEWRETTLADLARFFSHPARFLLTRRLGMDLGEEGPPPSDREPMDLRSGLDAFLLGGELAGKKEGGTDLAGQFDAVRASGVLPHGKPGVWTFERSRRAVEEFFRVVLESRAGEPEESVEVDLSLGGFRLSGKIEGLHGDRAVRYRFGGIRAVDQIAAWIRHLALCAFEERTPSRTTLLAGRKKGRGKRDEVSRYVFHPVENPRPVLEALLALYWEGLRRPLPFFPETSFAYGRAFFGKGKSGGDALADARREWERDGEYAPGKGDDPIVKRAFGSSDPLGEPFPSVAEQILGPLFDHAGGDGP
jgi:exodeoxyribonuclease V gamma subunit